MELSVRVASDSDVDVLAGLRRDWSEESSGGPIDDSIFEAAFAEWFEAERDTRTFFLAELDDIAVGMANVKRYRRMPRPGEPTGSWGYVGNVFISSQHRNVGLGETLMRHIVVWASGEELVHLRLAPSPLSEPFYARLGFRPGSVVEFDPIEA